MSGIESLAPLLLILPLAGFAITALIGRRLHKQAHWIPVLAIGAVWLIAMGLVVQVLSGAAPVISGEGEEAVHGFELHLLTWIPAGEFQVDLGLLIDPLTACLLIVVTTIGLLVHVYSIGYMSHDPGYWRFFAYLNLFMFSMLLLVLADNWLVVFVAWELVGLSSYLLIGFWYRKRSAMLAAKKAFIVNRVGDVGFALGIMAIFINTGAVGEATLNIRESIHTLLEAGDANPIPLFVVALLVFAGAMGKSAQFPLHVWLPDAMEGPTPVSALIHAATMVNAGVYLVARANPLFASAPDAMVIVAAIGIFTAILAASIAMTQTDIKRVLAYSTLSQLGYMFAALGVGAFTAAIFHLMTHGFFKGLLFLGSGSVIHAVHEEQDMRRMGGLSKKIPITYATMLIGSIAISGIPPLAGFFSKDEILGEAFKLGFQWVWLIGIVVAIMTAFYMFRLMGLTFWGEFRGPREIWDSIHESPRVMTIPLILLAIPSILLGIVLGLPLGDSTIHHWLEPSVAVAAAGVALAWRFFGVGVGPIRMPGRPEAVREWAARVPFLYRASLNKWWFDELNDLLFIKLGGRLAHAMWWFDREVVDGTVNAVGRRTVATGGGLRRVQTGRVQNYALGIAVGLIVMVGSYLALAGN
jgi:NADH-quinone oxidoreductase subunit L